MKASAVRAATWLLRFVPRPAAMAIAVVAADLCWMADRRRRAALHENFRHVAPDRSPLEHHRMARATFRNLARCSVDVLRIPLMTGTELSDLVEARGIEHLDRAIARGKGVILLSLHIGNWDLSGVVLAAKGYPVHAYAEDGTASFHALQRYRSATGLNLIPLAQGARAGYRELRRGAILGLLADRLFGGPGYVADFCAGRRELPIGPAALARWSGAPVLIAYLILNPAGPRPYLGVIEPIAAADPDQLTEGQIMQAVAGGLSRIVSEHPDQWFVFDPHWLPGQPESTAGPMLTAGPRRVSRPWPPPGVC